MKRSTLFPIAVLTVMLSMTLPARSETISGPIAADSTIYTESVEINALIIRLNEINSMDKSNLSGTEKRELRKEVRSINSKMSDGGGIYLSVGALLLVIILLIVLL